MIGYLYYIQRFSVYWICSFFFGSLGRLAFEAHSLIERSEIRNVIQKPGPSVRRITVSPYHRCHGSFVNYIVLMSNDYLPGIYRRQFDVV